MTTRQRELVKRPLQVKKKFLETGQLQGKFEANKLIDYSEFSTLFKYCRGNWKIVHFELWIFTSFSACIVEW
jgi:hypothetical protein